MKAWLWIFIGIAGITAAGQEADLVAVTAVSHRIRLDIRYATTNNFTGRAVYPAAKAFLRRATAEKLAAAQADLEQRHMGLKVFDAYRPLSVQKQFWALVPDERYVANPAKGSQHNRGSAVDVTLVRLDTGAELPMPSGYDDFSEKASTGWTNAGPEAIRNRTLLRRAMERHGFATMPTEWWHFDDVQWPSYKVLDVPFDHLP